MEPIKDSLRWFEIPVTDFDRARDFYSYIYDYDMPSTQVGDTLMGFLLVEDDGVGGAICLGESYIPCKQGTLVYLNGGKDLQIVLDRIEDAGGRILVKKSLIDAGLGYWAKFEDTEGNILGLFSRG